MTTTTAQDRYGLPLTTSSAAAIDAYADAIDRTLAGQVGADERLEEAVAADDGFALAQIALARSLQFRGRMPEARERAVRARALARGASRREQSHVETLAVAVESDPVRALELTKAHIAEFPRDAFVLSQASGVYGLIGFSGRPTRNEEQLALLQPLVQAYGDDWWFLSAYAFALNEMFRGDEARPLVERSLELERRNAHGAHTFAHVCFETGDGGSGATFLDRWLPDYQPEGQLYTHLSWHLALFELGAGNTSRVLDLYCRAIRPSVTRSQPLGAVADAASLLWRLGLRDEVTAALPWDEVRDFAARSFPRTGITFADAHCALAYAATHDQELITRLIDGLRERAAAGRLPAGAWVIDLVTGVAAYANGDYEGAVRAIEPIADEVVRLGGSHAQREVFEDTLIDAYLRTGRHDRAEAVLRERLARRPSARDALLLARAAVRPATADAPSVT
jgi:tetratricopeptide (TPR) repeat protein